MTAEIEDIHAEPRSGGEEEKIHHGGTESTEKKGRKAFLAREGAQKFFLRALPFSPWLRGEPSYFLLRDSAAPRANPFSQPNLVL